MGMFSRWLDSLAQQQFRIDTGGRFVFVPFGPRRTGYYVEAGDEPKLKALVTMYFLARSLVYLLGSTATFMFTQSLLSDERTSPLRRKLELGFTVYSISAVFLYLLPALLLWKTYRGLVERLCSLLVTVGSESVRQMQPPATDLRTRTLLVFMGVSVLILAVVLVLAIGHR
jgi:hypothetical protein